MVQLIWVKVMLDGIIPISVVNVMIIKIQTVMIFPLIFMQVPTLSVSQLCQLMLLLKTSLPDVKVLLVKV